ncbi:MAG: hypothetical protein QW514_04085, partial [Thermoprotei archaeon]
LTPLLPTKPYTWAASNTLPIVNDYLTVGLVPFSDANTAGVFLMVGVFSQHAIYPLIMIL